MQTDAWIDGRSVSCPEQLPVINPATGLEVTQVGLCDQHQIHEAATAAAAAGEHWRHASPEQRGAILRAIAAKLREDPQPIARLITMEQGKPLSQSEGEVFYAASFFEWFAGQAEELHEKRVAHPEPGREYRLLPTPLGVAGLITPWNLPLALGAKKVATALAAGCGAVWKPSEITPLSALAMGPLLAGCGVPDGLIQITPALGAVTGAAFASHDSIRVVSVTGSVRTGKTVMKAAADRLQKVSLELGGNAPFVVLPDAEFEPTIDDLLRLKLFVSGQVCVSANRVFIPESRQQEFVKCLEDKLAGVRVGTGTQDNIDAGPLIHQEACHTIHNKVSAACAEGAEIVAQNSMVHAEAGKQDGSWFPPTVLSGVQDRMQVASDELFGPVISLLTYTTVEEAVARANATDYGLAGYVYGSDVEQVHSVAEQLEVGIVGANEWRPLRAEVPFGGVKQSGIGAEGGTAGVEELIHWKVLSVPERR